MRKVLVAALGSALVAGVVVWVVMAASPVASRSGAGEPLPPPGQPSAEQQRAARETAEDRERAERLTALVEKLRPLAVKLGKPGPSDWLANHPEAGQNFKEYLDSGPVRPTVSRGTIYIQPLGDFSATQRKMVTITSEAMAVWFNVPTKFREDLKADVVPEAARRKNPYTGWEQFLTGHILDRVLKPNLPRDAAASICFTATDLWPGKGWNFVFGQASLEERVGVWSLYRFGDPDKSEESYRLALLRTLKLATHESGHMFSLPHCTAYECNMNGCNTQDESDRHPLALCPECMAKTCWATRAEPAERYRKLIELCRREGLKPEAAAYEKLLGAIEGK
ncbi:MAG TPA: archaemetzincin [Planctomycetota bacterium]|nr:archaemetzincin [Planctomycetota bacterium]